VNITRRDVSVETLRQYGDFVSILIVLSHLKNEDGSVRQGVSGKIKEMLEAGKIP
jgi:hypothetical protein